MKMKKWIAICLVLALALIAGCGSKTDAAETYAGCGSKTDAAETYAGYGVDRGAGYEMAEDFISGDAALMSASAAQKNELAPALPQNRKWIITMNLSAETDDLTLTLDAVSAQITGMGGYVESQSINNGSGSYNRRNASLTVRIPAEQVDSFVQEISGITHVVSSSRSVQDITLAYNDTEGWVNALKTEEARLVTLMEQADNMSDLLEIEGRLTEVRRQLESHASALRLYDNQVDYATVSLYINEVKKYTPVEEPSFFQRIKTGFSESLTGLGQMLVDLLAWFIVSLPYLITFGLVIFGIVAIVKRSLRKKKAKKAQKQAPKE